METSFLGMNISYVALKGRYNEVIPLLVSQGYLPLSVLDVMKMRVQVAKFEYNSVQRTFWWENSFATGDGCIFSAKGDMVKVVQDSITLRNIRPGKTNSHGAEMKRMDFADLPSDEYLISRYSARNERERQYTLAEVLEDELWHKLARHQTEFFSEYVDIAYKKLWASSAHNQKAMPIRLPKPDKRAVLMYPWIIQNEQNDLGAGNVSIDSHQVYVAGKKELEDIALGPDTDKVIALFEHYLGPKSMKDLIKELEPARFTTANPVLNQDDEMNKLPLDIVLSISGPYLGPDSFALAKNELKDLYA